MLHIIILSKGYFPDKLNSKDTAKDRVIVIASANDSIPVSAYQNEMLRNMEVKLLPDIKDSSAEGKTMLRIAQAMLIGQLTATEKEYEIYTDDAVLIKGLSPFTGIKTSAKRQPRKKVNIEVETKEKKTAVTKEKAAKKQKEPSKKQTAKTSENVAKSEAGEMKKESEPRKRRPMITNKLADYTAKKENAPEKKEKKAPKAAAPKKSAVKIPTLAQIKKVLGAANSSYAKAVLEACKNSNQITFEMNTRMELAKAGLDAVACQELAKTLNDEFGNALPTA
ncbi:hypothetical protein SAMN04487770_12771 [Butyrivibrio sp. ob235]|uniref:hypothetical protein n=1 Tax=Butyrivibrio sp. ob235 TaxID=1761780 RepID=UPI0008C6B000|nr:hypothetical protein [Butyrivibrio sp. ob235]SEM16793.1 hypothetical protein SAMN04487770_12771 [Butyrivibrio sp. ob235]